jgi:hypothetical protein
MTIHELNHYFPEGSIRWLSNRLKARMNRHQNALFTIAKFGWGGHDFYVGDSRRWIEDRSVYVSYNGALRLK